MITREISRLFASVVFLLMCISPHASGRDFDTICITENVLISAYKAGIYNPNAKVDWDKYSSDILSKDSFKTKDGETIHGLVWKAKNPIGYLLIAQGTSMLAAEIYDKFKQFSDFGLDVYIYDYRGYGKDSHVKTTLEGIISDYSVRLTELNKIEKYKEHYIYGISLGGVIFSNAIKKMHKEIDGAVFDSVPHAVPWYAFCPSKVDPINLLPETCKTLLIIGAEKDKVIGKRAAKLAKKAKAQCGAQTKIEEYFGHIFMDARSNTTERMNAALRHLQILVQNSAR